MKSVFHIMTPEWTKLDDHEKQRAMKVTKRAMGWRRWLPGLMLPYMATIFWIHPPITIYHMGFMYAGFAIPPLMTFLVYRAKIPHACWAILAARGEPICTACGYNLTGNVSGKCPECAEPVPKNAIP